MSPSARQVGDPPLPAGRDERGGALSFGGGFGCAFERAERFGRGGCRGVHLDCLVETEGHQVIPFKFVRLIYTELAKSQSAFCSAAATLS